ncbi:hypothetical protein GCM10027277_54010 [Pseudoduganella ginsengisoli]|nr:hypothetical protein [Pseudoduganella ginsengisoli]
MGNSLHNKIYLGRRLNTKHVQLALFFTAMVGATLAWLLAQ